jgi:hypothetical protein
MSNDVGARFHIGITVLHSFGGFHEDRCRVPRICAECREMAARMTDPLDRKALELQASAW